MGLQSYVDYVGPKISAAWLNGVDTLKYAIFADAGSKADAREALTSDAPFEIENGGTGVRSTEDLGTLLVDLLYPITTEEEDAGITDVVTSYLPGDSRRYVSLDEWASLGGELVLVGDYSIDAAVTFPSGTSIRGVGRPLVTVTTAGVRAFQCTDAVGFKLDGVRFLGEESSTIFSSTYEGYIASSTGAVIVTNSSDVRITNCEIDNFYNGISVLNCDRVWVKYNSVSGWYLYGIVGSLCKNYAFDYNTIIGCDQAEGIGAYGVSATGDAAGDNIQKSGSISYNVIQGIPSWDGIMSHDCDGLRIIGNDIRDVRTGIDIGHSISANVVKNVTIANNYIEATTTNTWGASGAVHSGIYVIGYDASHRVEGLVIANNIVSGFYNLAGATIAGNTGHILVAYANKVSVANNTVLDGASVPTTAAGIYLPLTSSNVSLVGNVLEGTYAAGGIRLASSTIANLVISGNSISQDTASDPAIEITSSTVTGLALGANGGNSTAPLTVSGSTLTYAQKNSGVTSVADGGTIAHGLAAAPTKVLVTGTTAADHVTVTALGLTTFTVAIKTDAGAAGTTANVYWQAEI